MDPDEKAHEFGIMVRDGDMGTLRESYPKNQVDQAVINTREDMVLVVSHLSSIAELLGSIKKLLVIIAVTAVVSAVALMWP